MNKDTCTEELDVAQEIIENLHEVVEKLRGSNRKLLRMVIERNQRIADLEKQLSATQPAASVRLPAIWLGAWEI